MTQNNVQVQVSLLSMPSKLDVITTYNENNHTEHARFLNVPEFEATGQWF